jgi:hypothetical protein
MALLHSEKARKTLLVYMYQDLTLWEVRFSSPPVAVAAREWQTLLGASQQRWARYTSTRNATPPPDYFRLRVDDSDWRERKPGRNVL